MMRRQSLTRKEIVQEFLHGRSCAQCVLGAYAQALGYDREETDRIAACFAGGMLMGQTCGAVTGALMAIGLASETQSLANERAERFKRAFQTKHSSCMCKELLGYDFSQPGQAAEAKESGKLLEVCPDYVLSALEILDQVLSD